MSRAPRRRLEAEAIRDALLFTSGRLSQVMYGPGARARAGDVNLAPEAARSPLAVREGPQQWRRKRLSGRLTLRPLGVAGELRSARASVPVRCQDHHDRADAIAVAFECPAVVGNRPEFLARRVKKEAATIRSCKSSGSIRSR